MTPAQLGPFPWEFYPVASVVNYLTPLLRAVLLVRPALLVIRRVVASVT